MGKGNHSQTYLVKNQHGYYFRIRVPEDIQPYLGKKELRYSLKADYFLEAREQAEKLADNVKGMFGAIRRGNALLNYAICGSTSMGTKRSERSLGNR